MVIIGSAAVVIGLGFSLLLSNLFTRPVRQMMEATQRISEGDYEVQIPTSSSDELGRLTREFNSMAKKLKSYHDLNIGQIMAEKRKSEAIIRSIDDGIVVVDDKLLVTGINPTAAAALGVEPDQVQEKHFLEVVKNEELYQYVKETVETGQPSLHRRKEEYSDRRPGEETAALSIFGNAHAREIGLSPRGCPPLA